jgi:hypothetical protein
MEWQSARSCASSGGDTPPFASYPSYMPIVPRAGVNVNQNLRKMIRKFRQSFQELCCAALDGFVPFGVLSPSAGSRELSSAR